MCLGLVIGHLGLLVFDARPPQRYKCGRCQFTRPPACAVLTTHVLQVYSLVFTLDFTPITHSTLLLSRGLSLLLEFARQTLVGVYSKFADLMLTCSLSSFYCIVLLTALFVSSCYWQPFPLSNSLSTPWSENVTTFAEALGASLSRAVTPLPPVMRVVDRCWCDLSTGSIFEPFNVSNWEYISVQQMKEDLELQNKHEEDPQMTPELASNDTVIGNPLPDLVPLIDTPTATKSWFSVIYPFHREPKPSSPVAESLPLVDQPSPQTVRTSDPPPQISIDRRPLLRREYDLRPYGLDMIIDFGWSRKVSG